jgi:hypothetical protein
MKGNRWTTGMQQACNRQEKGRQAGRQQAGKRAGKRETGKQYAGNRQATCRQQAAIGGRQEAKQEYLSAKGQKATEHSSPDHSKKHIKVYKSI